MTSDGHRLVGTIQELTRLSAALLHAATDMDQVRAACDMLEQEQEDANRARALETAIAVCYARAFTQSSLKKLRESTFAPRKGTDQRELHDTLMTLRRKVYAHTDVEGGRSVKELSVEIEGDVATVKHVEAWHPLDRVLLDPIRQLCDDQAAKLRLNAARLAVAITKERGTAQV